VRALVLAAGRGARMVGFTEDRPKCLIELGGRTLLDRQVAALRSGGIDEVGVVAGWHAEAFAGTGLPVFVNHRWATTTMAESLVAADEWLRDGPVLAAYGDIVYTAQTVRELLDCDADLAITYDPDWYALWRRRFADPLDDAETFVRTETGDLAVIGGRPDTVAEVQGQYIGLLRLTPKSWRSIRRARRDPEVRRLDMTGLLARLVRTMHVATVPVRGPWCEFDHPTDLAVGRDVLRTLDGDR
jgi:choline kinase